MQKHMKKLHIFGLVIIGLVTAACINTPEFFTVVNPIVRIKMILLIVLLILIAGTTIIRFWGESKIIPAWVPRALAVFLWIISGSMFFVHTEYFYQGVNLSLPFFHRVSFYTLPAIALESALVTGFEYLMNMIRKTTDREQSWIIMLFSLYTLMTMVVNFFAIGGIISVGLHIAIAQIVLVSSVGILAAAMLTKEAR